MTNENIKILKIEKVKNIYIVTTSDQTYKFDEDTIVKYFIVKDKEFSKSEFKKVLNELEFNKLFNKALKYLTYGERSSWEMSKYLKDDLNANKVINKLQSLGYVNDEKFSLKYVDYCYRNNKGPLYCQSKLIEKGIDSKIIDETINKYTLDMEKQVIESIINKDLKINNNLPVIAQKRRLINKLLRNGFSGEVVFATVNSLNITDNSSETMKKEYQKQKNKLANKDISDYEKKQRLIAYLLNKGYDYQKINEIIE